MRYQTSKHTADILTEYILPTARPTVVYEVWDDYGVAAVSVIREVVHENGETQQDEISLFQRRGSGDDLEDRPRRIQA